MIDPLFVALCRPAMKWGVPFEGFVFNVGITFSITILFIGSPVGFLGGILVHFALRELARVNPYFFHMQKLRFNTKGHSLTKHIWGGSRLQPSQHKTRNAKDIASWI